jgi:hypothetical protein
MDREAGLYRTVHSHNIDQKKKEEAAYCLGSGLGLHLLQDSRQGRLPLLPPKVSRWGLLGRLPEGT